MKIVKNDSNNPYYNLALEEWLMLNCEDDIFMLWQNMPSVIIGRYQNAYSEVNLGYAESKGIKVARRLTGGGAVYHDLGNLNFSFIVGDKGEDIDFYRFLSPIISALDDLGVKAKISGRNDLEVNGYKISGNAQCRKYGRILHHGTLLYSTDPDVLSSVLSIDEEKIKSKGIKSVRSRVTNLKDLIFLKSINELKSSIENKFDGDEIRLSDKDIAEVNDLAKSKYSTWEFIYGSSKSLEKKVKNRYDFGTVEAEYSSENGVITNIKIFGDFFFTGELSSLEGTLVGCRLIKEDIVRLLNDSDFVFYGITSNEIADLLLK